ncbi:MAG: hypothetical protein IJE97_10900 [Thermoguttaceae bacterium]|nr:hypothetical protein [Thermoguttaceae bacterium]
MKFADVLPGLLAGRRVRLRNRPLDDGGADREYLRLGACRLDELEIVSEYDNPGGRPSLYVRPFPLRRSEFRRDDWEFIDDEESEAERRTAG